MTTTTKADTEVMAATATTRADTAVDKADHAVDKAADLLQDFANKAAAGGGLVAKIAPELRRGRRVPAQAEAEPRRGAREG